MRDSHRHNMTNDRYTIFIIQTTLVAEVWLDLLERKMHPPPHASSTCFIVAWVLPQPPKSRLCGHLIKIMKLNVIFLWRARSRVVVDVVFKTHQVGGSTGSRVCVNCQPVRVLNDRLFLFYSLLASSSLSWVGIGQWIWNPKEDQKVCDRSAHGGGGGCWYKTIREYFGLRTLFHFDLWYLLRCGKCSSCMMVDCGACKICQMNQDPSKQGWCLPSNFYKKY